MATMLISGSVGEARRMFRPGGLRVRYVDKGSRFGG